MLDLAVIVPAAAASGVLILQGRQLGYLLAASLLVLEALLLPMIAIATVVRVRMGLSFTTAEVVGPIVGFATIALLALRALTTMLRHVRQPPRVACGATVEATRRASTRRRRRWTTAWTPTPCGSSQGSGGPTSTCWSRGDGGI
ncbi:MAG: hypothetical protein KY460_14495 [Actinobacteria bacterium]|nr:hypothetical protein [Actinomycetota bacterium]